MTKIKDAIIDSLSEDESGDFIVNEELIEFIENVPEEPLTTKELVDLLLERRNEVEDELLSRGHACFWWADEDIKERAKYRDIDVTDEQAKEILGILIRRHDANIGINWDVIDIWTDDYFEG